MPWVSNAPDPRVLSPALTDPTDHRLEAATFWARMQPQLRRFGISRVADITGLDRIGYPVAQAVRPDARSNAVTQGKANTLPAAALGAVLECLEMAAGETPSMFRPAAATELDLWRKQAPGADWPDTTTPFLAAWDLQQDRPAALPRDLISTDFARGAEAGAAPILRHSIGLGAGASLASALMHGLLECIEGDARLRAQGRGTRLALSHADPGYGPLLTRLSHSGFRTYVTALPNASGLTTVAASVMEEPSAAGLPLPAGGSATRACPSDAIAAALAEAVQARLAVISGAREDLTQAVYAHGYDPATLAREWQRHADEPAVPPPAPTKTPSMADLISRLGPVYAIPLHWDPDLPLAITRLIVPDLIADPLRLGET